MDEGIVAVTAVGWGFNVWERSAAAAAYAYGPAARSARRDARPLGGATKGTELAKSAVGRAEGTKRSPLANGRQLVCAYGDCNRQGNIRGTSPMMSSKLFKKVSQNCTVIMIYEHLTSATCSCGLQPLKKFQKFRMKQCTNTDCIRTVWNRDINAAINILNLFLELCHSGERIGAFKVTKKDQEIEFDL